ncbi:MAG: DNA/RNA helicase domain-containing protein, partial [Candidatus Nitrotoga sp.]
YEKVRDRYPIVITRDLSKAKNWLRAQARGSERYGIVVSSQAERLKPYAIDVKSPMDPVHWFLDGKDDVRSSYYLEDVATEFHVQGLELDWACVTWDADFRHCPGGWSHYSFCGNRWNKINKEERKQYLKNAYRVLLTRARQGMVLVVPEGDKGDHTRNSQFYDGTYSYLNAIGFPVI